MACLISVSLPATTFNRDQRRMAATIVAARTLAAYVLGAVLRGVALDGGCDHQWDGMCGAKAVELEAVIKAVVSEVARQSHEGAFGAGDDLYRPIESPACGRAHEILSRADVGRALDALTAALLIHRALTPDEAAEIILTAFVED